MKSQVLYDTENLITQKYKKGVHNGIDVVGANYSATDIIAYDNGEIVDLRTSYNKTDKTGHSYGNYIKIKHDNGLYTLYAHLKYDSIHHKKSDKVIKGEKIGRMGATGHANGVHLHFEVRNDKDERIDPTEYIEQNEENEQKEPENKPVESVKKELLTLVKRTIRGDFGTGSNRVRALGNNYDEVQRQVNLNYKHKTTTWEKVKIYEN